MNCDLCIKARDSGVYELLQGTKVVAEIKQDYVPDCVPGMYGDYVELSIRNGFIADWKTPDPSKFSAFFPAPDFEE